MSKRSTYSSGKDGGDVTGTPAQYLMKKIPSGERA